MDIFDQIEAAPRRDVFDEISPAEDVFDQADISRMPSMSLQPRFQPVGAERFQSPRIPFQPTFQSAPEVADPLPPILDPAYVAKQEAATEQMLNASPVPHPEDYPSGRELTEQTGIPQFLTTPFSAAAKLGLGVGRFMTSPQGASELAVAATPAAPAVLVKWAADMLKSGSMAVQDLGQAIGEKVNEWIVNETRRQNNLGPPVEPDPEFAQRVTEDVLNSAAMLVGGTHAGGQALSKGLKLPGEFRQSDLLDSFARDIQNAPLNDPNLGAVIRNTLPPRATPETLPELLRTKQLVDRAVQEANQVIQTGGPSALELLKAQGNEIATRQPSQEFRPGGGEAIAGKTSFNQPAEAAVLEQTRAARERTPNALQQETAQPVRNVREEPQQVQAEVPPEVSSPKADERGNQAKVASIVYEGGPANRVRQSPPTQTKRVLYGNKGEEFAYVDSGRTNPKGDRVFVPESSPPKPSEAVPAEQVLAAPVSAVAQKGKVTIKVRNPYGLAPENEKVQTITGSPAKIESFPDGEFVVYGDKNYWRVVEKSSGSGVGKGTTKASAIADATKNVTEFGPEKMRLAISRAEKLNVEPTKPIDTAIQGIESLQKKLRSGPQKGQTLMGVPSAILDTALEAARLSLKAGKSVAEAIEAALLHIRKNVKAFNEKEIRAMFERELSQTDNKPGVVGTAKGTASRGAPSLRNENPDLRKGQEPTADTAATLAKIAKVFEPAPKTSTPLKTKAINIVESLRTGISSKFRPVNKLAEDIAKSYGLSKPKDIAGIMEQLKGSQGKGEADIYRFDRDVSSLVKGDEKSFNEYMFTRRALDRLRQDEKDINAAIAGEEVPKLNRRSVSNFTINELEPALEAMKAKLGPEKLAKFEKAADLYQSYMDEALKLQVESGRMSKKVYDAIKEGNQFYAPFKVMKYLEETSKPEGTGKRIDTTADFTKAMQGIEDPDFKLGDMLGAARQSILLSRILADKNMAMRHVAELAQFDTQGTFIKRLSDTADVPMGMEAVNVLENGKSRRYAVNPDVAQAIQLYGGNAGGVISRVLGAFSVPFRAGATALNLPFQVSNLMADVPRQALVSKYGIRGFQDLVRYPLDFVHALYSSIAGDVLGRDNKLFLDFLDSGVAGTTIQEHLTPEALKFKEPTTISKSRKLASSVINLVPEFAQAIEQTSKVLGVKRAMRFEGVTSGKELAKQIPEAVTELRRFSGSPDFGRQGSAIENARLNLLFMFLNARIQGAIADVGRLTGRDGTKTAASTWFKLASAVGIPTAYLYYLNNQKENKADYDARSTQEKQNYWLIPKADESGKPRYITTEDGQKVRDFWRIPKRESSKWIANLTESALNFAQNRDPKAAKDFGIQMIQELSPVNIQGETAQERLESVGSSLNPVIKAPLELATGRDLYRHRALITDDRMAKADPELQYTERTPEAFKKLAIAMPDAAPEVLRSPIMLENLTRNLTAGLLTQFMNRKPVQGRTKAENQPLLQRFQSIPMTDTKQFQEDIQGLERGAANEQLNRHRAATKLLEENPKKQPEELAEIIVGNREPTHEDAKLIRHVVDLWLSKENGATYQDRQVIALPARQRALWIQQQIAGLDSAAQDEKLQELARKRIYTEAVAGELATLLGETK